MTNKNNKKEEQMEKKEQNVIIKSMSSKENIELLDIVGSDESNATKIERMIFKGVDSCLNNSIKEFFASVLNTEVSEIVNEDTLKIRMSLVSDENKSRIFDAPTEMVAEYNQGKEMQRKKREKALKAKSEKDKSALDLIKEELEKEETPPPEPKAENS